MSGVSHAIEGHRFEGIASKLSAVPETKVVKLCPDERKDEWMNCTTSIVNKVDIAQK